jgi:hypothetical protein
MRVGGQRHALAALPPGKTRYLLHMRVGKPRAGLDRCGKSRPHWDSIPGPSSPSRLVIPVELSRSIWNPKVNYQIHKGPPPTLVNILSQTHPVQALQSMSRLSTLSLPFTFRHPNPVHTLSLSHGVLHGPPISFFLI